MKTISVLVLYNPDINLLKNNIDSVLKQVDYLYVADNTRGGAVAIDEIIKDYENVSYKYMGGNVGIAKAQNSGILYAIENKYDLVYFLDQDSITPAGVVNKLKEKMLLINSCGIKVGGVAPMPYNRNTGQIYRERTRDFDETRIFKDTREVPYLMSSGSLMNIKLFQDIGMMEEKLFIDGVDLEICWRGSYYSQYRFFMDDSIKISHMLGEGDKRFLGRTIKISTPFRTYYQFRNYLFFITRRYVPFRYKTINFAKYVIKYFYFPLFCEPKWEYFKMINKGIWDGIFHR